jgi:hypothetical protein
LQAHARFNHELHVLSLTHKHVDVAYVFMVARYGTPIIMQLVARAFETRYTAEKVSRFGAVSCGKVVTARSPSSV